VYFTKTISTFVKRLVIGVDWGSGLNKEAKLLIGLASYRAMTHINDAQTSARLDQYVNQDPQLIFKARLVFKARLLFEEIR